MKTFWGVLATLAAVVLAAYLNTLAEPNLRYTLSSPIETATEKGAITTVQQIEIMNVGKAAAQPVQIRIKKKDC